MKAFSPEMFTEQAQASLRQEAYKLCNNSASAISSILEFEDTMLENELELRRDEYIRLLEAKRQDLELIDEGFLAGLALSALIGSVIGFIASLINLIFNKSKTVEFTFKIPKFDSSKVKDSYGTDSFRTDDFKQVKHAGCDNVPCWNPVLNPQILLPDRFKQIKQHYTNATLITSAEFKQRAESANISIIKFAYPNLKLVSGDFDCMEDVIKMGAETEHLISSVLKKMPDWDKSETLAKMDDLADRLDKIEKDIKLLDSSGSKETTIMNAWEYLNQKFDWYYNHYNGVWYFNDPKENPMLGKLNQYCTALYNASKKNRSEDITTLDQQQAKNYITAQRLLNKYANVCINITMAMLKAYNNYWNMVKAEIQQMNRISARVFTNTINANQESAIAYSESVLEELNYYVLDIDTEFYEQSINDTIARMSIYEHKMQMKAMNEEALIFSENISDYEKFQKLQAVNEALNDKIKRGYYNTIAALKEIFRKFMEKLNANFTTTKHYLDQYQKIIMNTDFINYQLKFQDLYTGIDRVYTADVPAMNYNTLAQDAPDFNTFFKKVVSRLNGGGDPAISIKQDQVQTVGDASTYFKSYFCMQDHEIEKNGKWFQQNIKKFFDFLYDIRKINRVIKDSLNEIDKSVNSIMKQAGVNQQGPEPGATEKAAAAPVQANADSAVFSILYNKYFTLNESGVLVEAEIEEPDAQPKPASPSQNMKNINTTGNEDNSNAATDNRATVTDRVKIYADVCSSMLKAKMSACEFIRNELMTVIRRHVQDHINTRPQQQQQAQQPQQGTQPPAKK